MEKKVCNSLLFFPGSLKVPPKKGGVKKSLVLNLARDGDGGFRFPFIFFSSVVEKGRGRRDKKNHFFQSAREPRPFFLSTFSIPRLKTMRRAASQLLTAAAAARTSGVASCSNRTEGAAAAFAAAANRSFFSSAATADSAPSSSSHVADEPFCRQRQLIVLGNRVPTLSPDAWVAPNAVLVGDVDLYDKVSVEKNLRRERSRR